jgi:N-acetylglutamate synthase-like GNAT family acetyltransferase
MGYKMRAANVFDLLSIFASRRRQRVLRLNPPYTLVIPDALMTDLLRSQIPVRPQVSFVYVCVDKGQVLGYVQARCRWRRRDEWTITTLCITDKAPDHVWEDLLEAVIMAAAEEGVIRLFVKVPESEPYAEMFRGLGFTRYSSERVWGNLYFGQSSVHSEEPDRNPLRKQSTRDSWDLMQLYKAVTPPAVQRAESLTSRQWHVSYMPRPWFLSQGLLENAFIWPDQAESEKSGSTSLGGFVRLLTGARGHWITLLFRADQANRSICTRALDYVLWKAARLGTKPVYCAVREYQAEVEPLLEERGFHLLTEQSLLVKYLAVPVKEAQPALVPFLAKNTGELVATDFSTYPSSLNISRIEY